MSRYSIYQPTALHKPIKIPIYPTWTLRLLLVYIVMVHGGQTDKFLTKNPGWIVGTVWHGVGVLNYKIQKLKLRPEWFSRFVHACLFEKIDITQNSDHSVYELIILKVHNNFLEKWSIAFMEIFFYKIIVTVYKYLVCYT